MSLAAWIAAASLAAAPGATVAPPDAPFCGAQNLDLGHGFTLLAYMFDKDTDFSLTYDVLSRDVVARDVTLAVSPIRLTFNALNSGSGAPPRIGYANLDAREPDGRAFSPGAIRLDCGGGRTLSAVFSGFHPANQPPHPVTFDSPFFIERGDIPACLKALEASGRFTLTFARTQEASPVLTLQGKLPLRAAMDQSRALIRRDLAQAQSGQCRVIPAPPPPF
jgi:hypothetical protein